jgi:uncharacterized cupin superfamily protein
MGEGQPEGVVRGGDVEWTETEHGETYGFRRGALGANTDCERLGANLYEVPPGKRSWPFHYHTANEEAVYVLSGTGVLRTEEGTVEIGAGDFFACTASTAGAHQLLNRGDEPLRFLCVSTMEAPDVVVYPDSEKVGVYDDGPPDGQEVDGSGPVCLSADAEVEYWDGEE